VRGGRGAEARIETLERELREAKLYDQRLTSKQELAASVTKKRGWPKGKKRKTAEQRLLEERHAEEAAVNRERPPEEITLEEGLADVFELASVMVGGCGFDPEGMRIWREWMDALHATTLKYLSRRELRLRIVIRAVELEEVGDPPHDTEA
jgi:hypothetical protein